LGIILEQKECSFGVFEVVVLKGQIQELVGAHLGMFVGYIQDCQNVPFENWHTSA
jgi:hypothetical protein